MKDLVATVGSGLGNLLAQQFGLGSECVDVTEVPTIAAFFATRRWPEYAHHDGPGIGVIYRFREPQTKFLRTGSLTLPALEKWLGLGEFHGGVFERFISLEEAPPEDRISGDRPPWIELRADGYHAGPTSHRIVGISTLGLTLRWSEILEMMRAAQAEIWSSVGRRYRPWGAGKDPVMDAEWQFSRVASQRGGMLIPSIIFEPEFPGNSLRSKTPNCHGQRLSRPPPSSLS